MENPMILNSKRHISKLTHRRKDIFQNKVENILNKKEMKLKNLWHLVETLLIEKYMSLSSYT